MINDKFKINRSGGQAIIEVLLAISIIAVCFIGLTITLVSAIRNQKFSQSSSLASKYAQEAIETIRVYRDREGFSNWATPVDICYDDVSFTALGSVITCGNGGVDITGTIFRREIKIESPENNKKIITATIYWEEGNKPHVFEDVTILTRWSK